MIQTIEETPNIEINDPVSTPASLSGYSDRVERGLARTGTIRVDMEHRFHLRLQNHPSHGLRHAVRHGGYTQRALPTTSPSLGNFDQPHRRWKVAPRRHPIPDLVQLAFQVLLEHRQGLPVHTGGPSIGPDMLVRIPDQLLGNIGSSGESVGGIEALRSLRSRGVNVLRTPSTSFRPFG